MAFTKEQRIQISKKVIQIPQINAALVNVVASIDAELVKITNEDNGNKDLMDRITPKINGYQDELKYLDGNVRTELLEQNMIDSSNKIKQNFFFPNDFETLLPNVPDGIWKFLAPFSGNIAIGKQYTEVFGSIETEQQILANIEALVSSVEAYAQVEKVSGRQCSVTDNGSCAGDTPPGSTDEATCTTNGGVWTPNLEGVKSPSDLVPDFNTLKTRVGDWKTILNNQKAAIVATDPLDADAGHSAENAAAIADIDNAITQIDAWLAIQDFDNRALPSDCDDFDDLDETDFDPAKLTTTVITLIKDEVTARITYTATRKSQVETYLGSVGQDLVTGEINGSGTGFYEDRFKVINVRLNLLGGSLNKKNSTEKGKDAQGALQSTNNNAIALYDTAIKVSKFKAPASNTGTIHVLDASEFSASDSVYIVGDDQEELSGTIISISNDTIFLDFNIPEKYTHFNNSRIYKVL